MKGIAMKIAICDDEAGVVEQLWTMLESILPQSEISAYPSGGELLAAKDTFDLLFLDIHLEDSDGIEIARQMRQAGSEAVLIFVTALKEYVFAAFDVAAFHYLLKPIDEKKLRSVVSRAVQEVKRRNDGKEKKLFVRMRDRNLTLAVKDIFYLESQKRKVAAHMNTETVTFYASLSDLEEQLGADFYRCHRGYLVNMAYIAAYDAETIWLQNNAKLYLAKERHPDFVKTYLRYLRQGGVVYV